MAKLINKTQIETIKTITIAILITGIVAFVAGMRYQASQDMQVKSAVQAATQEVKK